MQNFASKYRLALACGLAIIVLAGCGGGQADGGSSGTAAAAEGSAARQATLAVATSSASADDSTAWTTIATEGQTFTVSGTQTVRFGAGTSWITLQVTDSGTCSNAAFGNDPAYGTVKSCQVASGTSTSGTTTSSGSSSATWTQIAAENASFTVSGTQTVRFGAGSSWITLSVTGSGDCTNAFFGSDPAYGTVKSCQLESSTGTSAWTQIAVENANFTVSGTQTVRFGAASSWITKSVTGSGVCSNTFFGSDPLYGTAKTCQVASSTSVASAGVCTVPASATDTSSNTATVGNGTAASCTAAALQAAVNAYPVVKFNCGASPVTIPISATITVPTTRNTVIDGGNTVTLDGQGAARILSLSQNNYRTNSLGLTLQHIALVNGKAPTGGYVAPSTSNPSCSYGYASGAGAAVYVQDARLYVFDVDFENNAAATPGPDVGGGGIYAAGSLDVLIAGSRFNGNTGSNSGAVGMLNSNLRIYNSSFTGNSATGTGMNYQDASVASCPGVGQSGQGGAGGSSGAVGIDGGDDTDVTICGSTFSGNKSNELAGAVGRTADGVARALTIDRSTFANNTARQGGAFYLHNLSPLSIVASTFSGNTAVGMGVGQLDSTTFSIVNSTFANNQATKGVAGALFLDGTSASSVIQNSTFAGNQSSGGSGYFSAAIFGDSNFTISNTVFANNTTADAYNPMQCGFTPTAGTNDMQWPSTRSTGGLTDTPCVSGISFANPLLGALAANGGTTQTMLPASNSPLKGAGRNCPATDQLGKARSATSCTVGAVE